MLGTLVAVGIGVLAAGYLLLVAWYRRAWQRLPYYQVPPAYQPATHLSVVVPARNEEGQIGPCLHSLLAQQYPPHLLQIIVVDDASTDNTAQLVQAVAAHDARVQLLPLPPTVQHAHKKRAIEAGIAAATGTLVVCTDADCTHAPQWLRSLAHAHEVGGAVFVAGPVAYHTQPTVLSVFQTLDFATLQGITGASVGAGVHAMCNGASIAYSRQAFYEVGGFKGIDKLPTGDDMLLMYKIWQRYPQQVQWLKSRDALVHTHACPSWQAFLQQRIRWASKAAYFDDRRIFLVLLLVYLFNAGLLLLLLTGFFVHAWLGWWALGMLAAKALVEAWMLAPVLRFFQQQRWLRWFGWLQVPHLLYTVLAGWLGRFGRYQWKGRTIEHQT